MSGDPFGCLVSVLTVNRNGSWAAEWGRDHLPWREGFVFSTRELEFHPERQREREGERIRFVLYKDWLLCGEGIGAGQV